MRVISLCMLFVSIAIIFLVTGPREHQAADRALIALKKAAGIALLLQRKRFRIIPIPLPLPLPLPIPIELKNHQSWPKQQSWAPAPSWPSHHVSHSWSAPAHVDNSWSSWSGDSWGGDSWAASDSYGSIADAGSY